MLSSIVSVINRRLPIGGSSACKIGYAAPCSFRFLQNKCTLVLAIPTVFTLCNMYLKLMHFGSSFVCILGSFLVYIEPNLNAKSAALSVDFICKMQWFLIYIARRFHVY